MNSERGLSTPLDVAVGLLLVGAAVGVIAGVPAHQSSQADPGPRGSVLLGSVIEVSYETERGPAAVTGTIGGLVGEAVIATGPTAQAGSSSANKSAETRAFVEAVRRKVGGRVSELGVPIQIVGYCRSGAGDPLVIGRSVPQGAAVTASVYDSSQPATLNRSTAAECDPAVVVRRWSR